MAQILIRNIEDAGFQRLKAKAAAAGKSTEAFARSLIERAARTDRNEAITELDRLRALTPLYITDSSADIIRELRDAESARR
jgi:plasmid stability protein